MIADLIAGEPYSNVQRIEAEVYPYSLPFKFSLISMTALRNKTRLKKKEILRKSEGPVSSSGTAVHPETL